MDGTRPRLKNLRISHQLGSQWWIYISFSQFLCRIHVHVLHLFSFPRQNSHFLGTVWLMKTSWALLILDFSLHKTQAILAMLLQYVGCTCRSHQILLLIVTLWFFIFNSFKLKNMLPLWKAHSSIKRMIIVPGKSDPFELTTHIFDYALAKRILKWR